jgi:hypothetical protein
MNEIDFNTATRTELIGLPLIGPALADRILAERDRLGGFARLEDLLGIPGVTRRVLDAVRGQAGVGGGSGGGSGAGKSGGGDENPPVRPGKQHGGDPVLLHEAYIEHHLAGETPATSEAYERAQEQFQRIPGATRRPPIPGPDDTPEE